MPKFDDTCQPGNGDFNKDKVILCVDCDHRIDFISLATGTSEYPEEIIIEFFFDGSDPDYTLDKNLVQKNQIEVTFILERNNIHCNYTPNYGLKLKDANDLDRAMQLLCWTPKFQVEVLKKLNDLKNAKKLNALFEGVTINLNFDI